MTGAENEERPDLWREASAIKEEINRSAAIPEPVTA
jgi:hypothetical protein